MFSHEEYCDLAGDEVARFADVVRPADASVPVPTCGRWTLTDLVHHTGVFHRWVEILVTRRSASNDASGDTGDWDPDATMATHADWLLEADKRLLPVLRAADPDLGMWAWGADQSVRFWSRRATHETGVHRADAELALGRVPEFAAEVAVDGVDEFLANVWHAGAWRPRISRLRGNGETIGLHATDSEHDWTITLGPEKPVSRPGGAGAANVTVHATATDLYLLLWGRYRGTDPRFTVVGDAELLATWQRNSAV